MRLRATLSALFLAFTMLLTLALPAAAEPPVHQLITVDPLPFETREASLTITGKVLGSFAMELRQNGAAPLAFHGHGNFAATVALNPGPNFLQMQGVDPTGRQVWWSHFIFYRMPPSQLTLVQTGPGLAADGTSTTTVTATALDAQGGVVWDHAGAVTFTSSNPDAVAVVTETVAFAGGKATATLRAGTVAQPAVITASAPGLPSAAVTVTPVSGGVLLIADPSTLAAEPSARGTLIVRLMGVPGPLTLQLSSSNPGAIGFETGASTTVTVTAGEAQVPLLSAGFNVTSATITGRVLEGPVLNIEPVTVQTAIVGMPYQLSLDPIAPAAAGSTQQAVVRVRDWNGTQISSAGPVSEVVLERISPDGSVEQLGTATTTYGKAVIAFVTPVAGTYTLRVTGVVLGMGFPLMPAGTTYTVQ